MYMYIYYYRATKMDCEDGEDSHSFGQRVPPLYVDIKEVLQEYPDGQIFKVE